MSEVKCIDCEHCHTTDYLMKVDVFYCDKKENLTPADSSCEDAKLAEPDYETSEDPLMSVNIKEMKMADGDLLKDVKMLCPLSVLQRYAKLECSDGSTFYILPDFISSFVVNPLEVIK